VRTASANVHRPLMDYGAGNIYRPLMDEGADFNSALGFSTRDGTMSPQVPQVAGANTRHHPCSMLWSTVLIHVHFSCEVRHDALVLESDGKIVPLWIETAVGCMVSTLVRGSGPFRVRVARGAESDAFHWFVVECDRQAIAQRRLLVWFKFRSVILHLCCCISVELSIAFLRSEDQVNQD